MSSASAALPQPGGKVKAFLRLVMIEHSVFALPFAYIAALTAMFRLDGTIHWGALLLVTVCMVGLRTFAMAANRIIDREIDARNPRTAARELVTGAVSVQSAWTGALIALAVFLGSAALLNPLCLALAPVAVIPMVVYPYGKRFTNFPQAILGIAQAMGPSAPGSRSPAMVVGGRHPRPRGRHLDRRLRPDLRLPGRGDGPRGRREVGARAVRHPGRHLGRARLPLRDHGAARLVRRGHRRGRLLLARPRDRRAAPSSTSTPS